MKKLILGVAIVLYILFIVSLGTRIEKESKQVNTITQYIHQSTVEWHSWNVEMEKRMKIRQDKITKINIFLSKHPRNPYQGYGEHFLDIADKYGIDYRILPSITIAEQGSGCPEAVNCFGMQVSGKYPRMGTRTQEIEEAAKLLKNIGLLKWNGPNYSAIGFINQI